MELFLLILICSAAVLATSLFIRWGIQEKIAFRAWSFGSLAAIFIPFGLAWCVTSFGEGEPFAGYMGIAIFSGLGVVCALLAYNSIKKSSTKPVILVDNAKRSGPLGIYVAVILLALLGGLLLPVGVATYQVAGTFGSKESVKSVLATNIFSDTALPTFVKSAIAYETIYGEYPETLEERMMQSMISGVSNEQLVALLDKALPESDRLALLNQGADAVEQWLTSDQAYPELTIEISPILENVSGSTPFLMAWIYRNFAFPPMEAAKVAKFNAGEFPDDFKEYMGTPPDSINPILIEKGAVALKSQIAGADAPEKVVLADQLKEQMTSEEMKVQKAQLTSSFGKLKIVWVLPVVLLVVALGLALWKLPKKLLASGYLLTGVGLLGLLLTWPLRDIEATVFDLIVTLSEKAPAPALAFIHHAFPDLMLSLRSMLFPILNGLFWLGIVLLIVAYRKRAMLFIHQFISKIKNASSQAKIA